MILTLFNAMGLPNKVPLSSKAEIAFFHREGTKCVLGVAVGKVRTHHENQGVEGRSAFLKPDGFLVLVSPKVLQVIEVIIWTNVDSVN